MPLTLTCPHCERPLTGPPPSCPGCGGDLRTLTRLAEFADWYYNEALRLARAGRWPRAAEAIGVALALNPNDAEARHLRGKIRSRLDGRPAKRGRRR